MGTCSAPGSRSGREPALACTWRGLGRAGSLSGMQGRGAARATVDALACADRPRRPAGLAADPAGSRRGGYWGRQPRPPVPAGARLTASQMTGSPPVTVREGRSQVVGVGGSRVCPVGRCSGRARRSSRGAAGGGAL